MKRIELITLRILIVLPLLGILTKVQSQEPQYVSLKKGDIRKVFKKGDVKSIRIIAPETFNPGRAISYDLAVETSRGFIRASDYNKLVWKNLVFNGNSCSANDDGGVFTYDASAYYPPKDISFSYSYGIVSDEAVLSPDYCYNKFTYYVRDNSNDRTVGGSVLQAFGALGKFGSNGSGSAKPGNGGNGKDGGNGSKGPNVNVKVEEAVVQGSTHIILEIDGKAMAIKPDCGEIEVISRGGDGVSGGGGGLGGTSAKLDKKYIHNGGKGGNGGNGGDGGDGGDIIVSGAMLSKYKNQIQFLSQGGSGGYGGAAGAGGSGKSTGSKGSQGAPGNNGSAGKVIFDED